MYQKQNCKIVIIFQCFNINPTTLSSIHSLWATLFSKKWCMHLRSKFFFLRTIQSSCVSGCPFIMIFMEIFGSSVNNFMEIFGIFGIQFPLGFRKNEFVQKVRKFYKFYFILVIQVHFLCMNYHTIIISMRRDIPSDPIFYFKSSWNVSSQLNVIRILVWV